MKKFSEYVQENKVFKFKHGDIVIVDSDPFAVIVTKNDNRLIVSIPDFVDTFDKKKVWDDNIVSKKNVQVIASGRDEEEQTGGPFIQLNEIYATGKNIA